MEKEGKRKKEQKKKLKNFFGPPYWRLPEGPWNNSTLKTKWYLLKKNRVLFFHGHPPLNECMDFRCSLSNKPTGGSVLLQPNASMMVVHPFECEGLQIHMQSEVYLCFKALVRVTRRVVVIYIYRYRELVTLWEVDDKNCWIKYISRLFHIL